MAHVDRVQPYKSRLRPQAPKSHDLGAKRTPPFRIRINTPLKKPVVLKAISALRWCLSDPSQVLGLPCSKCLHLSSELSFSTFGTTRHQLILNKPTWPTQSSGTGNRKVGAGLKPYTKHGTMHKHLSQYSA